MILCLSEEYGYRYWIAELTEGEYQDLLRRWETMRGLCCLVPVKLIVPQAEELLGNKDIPPGAKHCHIHECSDSWIDGSTYKIPEDESFWIDGVKYEINNDWGQGIRGLTTP